MADQILLDTGPIVALLDKSDQHHVVCTEASKQVRGVFYTTWPVITEACYLLRSRPDLVQEVLSAVYEKDFELLQLDATEINEIGGWLAKYRDQDLDLADACLAYLSEREEIESIFTIDRRHFSLIRNSAGNTLTLFP